MKLIPTKFFITSSSAVSPISGLNAFDRALIGAGIGEQNLVSVSSVIPIGAEQISPVELPMGAITHCVLAQMRGTEGEMISAGIAYGFRKDGPVWRGGLNRRDTIALFCHFGISMAILGYLTDVSPMILWHHSLTLPSSVTEVVTEERIKGEVSFRVTKLGDLTHLEAAGEPRSTAGLFPEVYTGIDSTDPAVNGTMK